jgi:hypothetical protein
VARLEDIFALPLAAGHLVVIGVDVVLAHAIGTLHDLRHATSSGGRDTSAVNLYASGDRMTGTIDTDKGTVELVRKKRQK